VAENPATTFLSSTFLHSTQKATTALQRLVRRRPILPSPDKCETPQSCHCLAKDTKQPNLNCRNQLSQHHFTQSPVNEQNSPDNEALV
jgi:hypothetical protein